MSASGFVAKPAKRAAGDAYGHLALGIWLLVGQNGAPTACLNAESLLMTQRLYYDDSFTHSFSAHVVETFTHNGHPAVVLDRTYFYPTGGGQPHDTGSIGGARVIDVFTRADDKAVVHLLDGAAAGEVACEIDWTRRFDLMQQHTGQHILTQAFVQTAGAHTVGFHLSENSVTVDLDAEALTAGQVATAEGLANQILYDDRPVTTRIIDPEAAEGVRMRRVPDALATGGLRVVEVQDFDMTACGGTHVTRTGQIGTIKVVGVERYKGGQRIEFRCGGRALADYDVRVGVTGKLTNALTCGLTELPAAVERLQNTIRERERTIKALQERLVEYEAADLLANAAVRDDARWIIAAFDDRDAAALRWLAGRLVREVGVVALLGISGEKTHVICARSADLSQDMNALLQAALAPFGGRGGGNPAQAQGGGGAATRDQVQAALAAAAHPHP
ncbi:MAG: hypothetical protein KJ065_22395 [Anaerolineae bacterium]|nr:hypothetical protein [Anaerolineae bacterium]